MRPALFVSSLAAVVALAACGGVTREVPIETPIRPKLDVSMFQRVLVAGFRAGGTEEIGANPATVRRRRSQRRN